MTASAITALNAQVGDIAVSSCSRFEVVATTDTKIALGDPSAAKYRYQATKKWYNRTSKILATWTFEKGQA